VSVQRIEPRAPKVAGVDTRDAKATPTVVWAARAAATLAGPGWVAAIAAPMFWRRWWDVPDNVLPWLVIGIVFACIGAALAGWRREPFPAHARGRVLPLGADAAMVLLVLGGLIAVAAGADEGSEALREPVLIAFLLPAGALLAAWTVGRAARLSAEACVDDVRPAANGLVVTASLLGLLITGHLALVLDGSGASRAAVWAIAYVAFGVYALARAGGTFARDRGSAERRASVSSETVPDDRRDAALVIDGVAVRFGVNDVLRGTSLTAAAGEVVALVGGNGAGKSTLLRVAAGLQVAEQGRVFVAGEDISELLPEERAAAGLAFVSGARPVFPDMRVIDNLRVAAFRTHLTSRAFDVATHGILEIVPVLARRRDAKAGVLSGGEQRLLAVAQTLYRRPKVLLADELSLGLDTDARAAVLELLRLLADQGVAVVAVDHDLPALLPRADRAALLARGTITDFVPAGKILEQRTDLLPATFLAGAAG